MTSEQESTRVSQIPRPVKVGALTSITAGLMSIVIAQIIMNGGNPYGPEVQLINLAGLGFLLAGVFTVILFYVLASMTVVEAGDANGQ